MTTVIREHCSCGAEIEVHVEWFSEAEKLVEAWRVRHSKTCQEMTPEVAV